MRAYANGANRIARMPEFILSEFVEPELIAIWDYIAIENIDTADRFLEAAYGMFQELARMPGVGRCRNFPQARLNNLRSFRIKDFENHLIFYSPIQDEVEVFHVLHGARDLERF